MSSSAPNPSTDVSEPGTIDMGLEVVTLPVSDVDRAKSFDVGDVFHLDGSPKPGPDPQRRSYLSYASFADPDGNTWLLQEVTTRLPGRLWED